MRSLVTFLLILFLASCGKKDNSKDMTVSGNVRNNCTGSGFADVTVNFITTRKKSFGKTESSKLITKTDASGNFSFVTEVSTSDKYTYAISIPGYSNYDTEFFGTGQEIEADKLGEFQQFGVSASFKTCPFSLPAGTNIVTPDTFTLILQQRVLHSFEPERVWKLIWFPQTFEFGIAPVNFGNYPMGWWQITLDKTKSGVHTVIQDSIYLGMGASATYTIPW
ncbi:MAG: hypothetical protein ACJ76F_11705 [Bacteroidia bacterium]